MKFSFWIGEKRVFIIIDMKNYVCPYEKREYGIIIENESIELYMLYYEYLSKPINEQANMYN